MKEPKMSSHLSGGRLNISLLQECMRKELLNLLQLCEGPKVSKSIKSLSIALKTFNLKCTYT